MSSDQEPTAPSRRAETRGEVVIKRQALVGDLDAIVLKALRKKPEDRYRSVDLLAADLRAYLEGRPVEARRGSRLYRALKFGRRHRYPIAAAYRSRQTRRGFAFDSANRNQNRIRCSVVAISDNHNIAEFG